MPLLVCWPTSRLCGKGFILGFRVEGLGFRVVSTHDGPFQTKKKYDVITVSDPKMIQRDLGHARNKALEPFFSPSG